MVVQSCYPFLTNFQYWSDRITGVLKMQQIVQKMNIHDVQLDWALQGSAKDFEFNGKRNHKHCRSVEHGELKSLLFNQQNRCDRTSKLMSLLRVGALVCVCLCGGQAAMETRSMPYIKIQWFLLSWDQVSFNRNRIAAITPGGAPGFQKLLKCGWSPRAVLGVLASAVVFAVVMTAYTPPTSIAFITFPNSAYRTQSGQPGHMCSYDLITNFCRDNCPQIKLR